MVMHRWKNYSNCRKKINSFKKIIWKSPTSFEKDIIGAKSANMNYIWLKNENNEDFDISASKLISSITEVPELLKNW